MLAFLMELTLKLAWILHLDFASTFLFGEHEFPKCED